MVHSGLRIFRIHSALYLMMIPVILYFGIFVYYPLYEGAVASFQEFRLLGDRPWIGLQNYRDVLDDPAFGRYCATRSSLGAASSSLASCRPSSSPSR
jgi:putative aldouronate transport system permease protein